MYQFLPSLLLSTPREICQRSQSFVWICPFRVMAVIWNLCATKKVLGKCKDHVNISSTFHIKRILFAVLFLYSGINYCWHQYKRRNQAIKDLLSWVEFKLSFGRLLVIPEFLWILPRAEEVYNWVSHLEHLQSIKFNAARAPEESNLI